MMRINAVVMFGALLSTMFPNAAQAAIPDSRCQYAADGEYDDILSVLPWVDETVDKKSISFKRPKCFETQVVAPRYADTMLYNGIIKLVGGTVVGGASVSKFNNTPDFEAEMKMILSASDKEISSPDFAKKIASLAGRKDILEIGTRKVGGLNAFYSTTKMERRIGNTVVYRGIQRVYLVPLKNGKHIVSVNYVIGVLGVDEFPYADFKAFKPIGEKIVNSVTITEKGLLKLW